MLTLKNTQLSLQNINQEFNTTDDSYGIYSDQEISDQDTNFSLPSPLTTVFISDCSTPEEGLLADVHHWNYEHSSTSTATERQRLTSSRKKKFTKTATRRSATPMKILIQKKLFESELAQGYEY